MSKFSIPGELIPNQAMIDDLMKQTRVLMPMEMASAVNLMAHPLAGASAMTALSVGFASQAVGIWLGAMSGAAAASQRLFLPMLENAEKAREEFRDASRTARMRAVDTASALIADAKGEVAPMPTSQTAPVEAPVEIPVKREDLPKRPGAKAAPAESPVETQVKREDLPKRAEAKEGREAPTAKEGSEATKAKEGSEATKARENSEAPRAQESSEAPRAKESSRAPRAKESSRAPKASAQAARAASARAHTRSEPAAEARKSSPRHVADARRQTSRRATAERAAASAAQRERAEPELRKPAPINKPKKPDDLKAISGIGPKLEQVLNAQGIWTYDQIARLSKNEAAWVEDMLGMKGRIGRDNWIAQASKLAKAGH
jgi:predicted flap endonuclease-1-like 5' DNA nuclease